jgi:hypothetical protein
MTSATAGGELWASCPGRFILRERAPVPTGQEAGLTLEQVCTIWKRENSLPYRDSELQLLQPVASRKKSDNHRKYFTEFGTVANSMSFRYRLPLVKRWPISWGFITVVSMEREKQYNYFPLTELIRTCTIFLSFDLSSFLSCFFFLSSSLSSRSLFSQAIVLLHSPIPSFVFNSFRDAFISFLFCSPSFLFLYLFLPLLLVSWDISITNLVLSVQGACLRTADAAAALNRPKCESTDTEKETGRLRNVQKLSVCHVVTGENPWRVKLNAKGIFAAVAAHHRWRSGLLKTTELWR